MTHQSKMRGINQSNKKHRLISKISIVALATFTLLNIVACGSKHAEEEEETTFKVTNPLLADTTTVRDYVSQIRAIQHIELRALERGYIQNIYVDEGQHVKKGQLMFQINPSIYKADLQKAKAEANYAEIEYQNTKQLFDKNVVSKNELALAQSKFDKANAEVSLAQAHYNFTEIRAPFDGIMDHFQVRIGSLVDEGDLLTTISDNSQMWVYFNVPEAEYLDYKTKIIDNGSLSVHLMMANNQAFKYPGFVKAIEADFNNETGNIAFRATFPNPDGLLRHGETGNIQMFTELKNALIIPQKATYEVLEKKFVFVVDKNNVVKSREITIKDEIPDLYIIASGLEVSDKIIYEGIRKVKENEKIHYDFLEPKAVIKNLSIYVE